MALQRRAAFVGGYGVLQLLLAGLQTTHNGLQSGQRFLEGQRRNIGIFAHALTY